MLCLVRFRKPSRVPHTMNLLRPSLQALTYQMSIDRQCACMPCRLAFGRLRTAAVTNLLDIKHVYDKNPLQISEVTAGTATSVFNQQFARVRMSTSANNDLVIRQSKTHPIYQPGKSQLFEGSFSNFQIETNVIKRVGCFTSTTGTPYNSVFDGFFLESNGVTSAVTFNIYLSGSCTYSANSTTWASTQFNPNNLIAASRFLAFF